MSYKVTITPETVGAALGAGLASATLVIAGAKRWFSPSEKKMDKVVAGLGAANGGPTVVSLVLATADHVQRISSHLETFHEEFREHDRMEADNRQKNLSEHQLLQTKISASNESVALAAKTVQVAEDLASKTLQVAQELHQETLATARALAAKPVQVAEVLAAKTVAVAEELHKETIATAKTLAVTKALAAGRAKPAKR